MADMCKVDKQTSLLIDEPDVFIPNFGFNIKPKELTISPCSFRAIRRFVETHHYSHGIKGGSILYCFRCEFQGYLVGAAIFGRPCMPSWKIFNLKPQQIIELRRLVLLDEVGRNAESYMIGFMLRYIHRHFPHIKAVVSYADPEHGHQGTIYKASNFKYCGQTAPGVVLVDKETQKSFHCRSLSINRPYAGILSDKVNRDLVERQKTQGKHRYVYFFDRKERGEWR